MLIPVGVGVLASVLMAGIFLGLVSWAESLQHAVELFWQDRWLVLPIILGFGVQAGLFATLKLGLFMPANQIGASGALTGASGGTSTVAMAACCAHHVADVLPFLGLSAAAAFLANYRLVFMGIGLATTLIGIAVMLVAIHRARRRAFQHLGLSAEA